MRKRRKIARKKLINRARKLAGKGYSVIPIQGDLSAGEPKKPTMKWRAFQKRIASVSELGTIFDERAGALAVVCGQVSRLLVIDFDDHLRYQRFCRHLPQFADSYTVKTRRGYHVYFRTEVNVPSHQFDGGDIKGEGSYVVAPPSVIGDVEYVAVKRVKARWMDETDVDAILKYFHVGAAPGTSPVRRMAVVVETDIADMYERLSPVIGRNNALYRCAHVGRLQGMSGDEIEKTLLQRHVLAEGEAVHKFESSADRFREGRRTVASALGRSVGSEGVSDGIPNSVRERLLGAQGSSVMARLLDIMKLAGWAAERYFRMSEVIELCSGYGLNRKSVMAALTGDRSSFNGRHIIARRYVEYLDMGGLNVGMRGRPAQLVFQAPSVSRLLKVLGVSWSPSDSLEKGDLQSSHAYRRALHREYVKRVSPQLPMAFLAGRVGVSARTLRRYNVELGVQVSERIGRFGLSWESLKCLPQRKRDQVRNQTPGYWLAVEGGARFPAWRHIGATLLRRGAEGVQVCVRRASVLNLGKPDVRSVVYESMSVRSFMGLRMWREGKVEGEGMVSRVRELMKRARRSVARVSYQKLRLAFDTVAVHIAEDKVAETIRGYLYADDGVGGEVRRPARRGVAYRMLKEFGEGNVYLALRDSYSELMASMARHALRVGDDAAGAGLLARSLA